MIPGERARWSDLADGATDKRGNWSMSIVQELYSDRAKALLDHYFPFPVPRVPVKYNFDQGAPAPELYPFDDLALYITKAIQRDGARAFDYHGDAGYEEMTYGFAGLRETLALRIEKRDGRPVRRGEVMIVNGSSHGLSLVAQAFLGPGDGAVVESLSFPFMLDYMQRAGATLEPVPVDDGGMDVEAVPAALQRLVDHGHRPKLIYVIPSFQVPTGTLMSLQRRRRLIEIAQSWGILVVEDNCYHDLYFDIRPPPTLFSLDESGVVVQSDSFSKVLAPGLRLGWLTGSSAALAPVAAVRQDLGSSQLLCHALDLYLGDGRLDSRLESLRPAYKAKRDIALAALREHCGDLVTFQVPQGGIYFWLRIDPRVDCAEVSSNLEKVGVACRPGERFTDDPSGAQYLRVSFLQVPKEEIERGIRELGTALRTSLHAQP
jgi:2-aminoadipate transaminase